MLLFKFHFRQKWWFHFSSESIERVVVPVRFPSKPTSNGTSSLWTTAESLQTKHLRPFISLTTSAWSKIW